MDIPIGYCQCGCGRKTKINKKARPEYGYLKGQPSRFVSGHDKRRYPQTCSISGCRRRHRARGYCSMHYKRIVMCGSGNLSPTPLHKKIEEPCKIKGCQRKHFCHGYCKMHYGRIIRYGSKNLSPNAIIKKFPDGGKTVEEKFLERITKVENGCWIWAGPFWKTRESGYGRLSISGKGIRRSFFAHRLAYQYFKGSIPAKHLVHHTCENPSCVNPDHLELITRQEHILLHRIAGMQRERS